MQKTDTDKKPPVVWVIVLNCNGMDVLPDCLASLKASDYPRVRICISDNASTDGSPEWAAEHFPDTRIIRNAENLGWSGANNVGIKLALEEGADYVWILNNDVEVEPDCIRLQIEWAEQHPACGVVGPLIYYHDDRDKPAWFAGGWIDFELFKNGHNRHPGDFESVADEFRYITGCAMMVHRRVFEKIGLIDERFFIYQEDTDFCRRAVLAGFKMELVKEAVMTHKVSSFSGGEDDLNPWRMYQSFRSYLLFWRKHLGLFRFHRHCCDGNLGKFLQYVVDRDKSDLNRALSAAVIDALWYFVSGARKPKQRVPSPKWFVRLIQWKPWIFDRMMSYRPLNILQIMVRR